MGYPLVFRAHALTRMAERDISVADVRGIIESGEIIRGYPDDIPYPSRLILGRVQGRVLHVVAADNPDDQETIVITVYSRSKFVGRRVQVEEEAMKCVICKNGETHPGTATVTPERDGTTVVFKNVPAQVCENCGETYIDGVTARELLDAMREATAQGVVVEVRHFAA